MFCSFFTAESEIGLAQQIQDFFDLLKKNPAPNLEEVKIHSTQFYTKAVTRPGTKDKVVPDKLTEHYCMYIFWS